MRTNQRYHEGRCVKPIQLRINLFFLALFLLIGGFAYDAYIIMDEIRETQSNIQSIAQLRIVFDEIRNKNREEKYIKYLQSIRSELRPEIRQNLMSGVIQAFTAGNVSLMERRIQSFTKYDVKAYETFVSKKEYLQKKIFFHSGIFFSAILVFLVFYRGFVSSQILKPLSRTTERMVDFLNGKYSYHFGTPPENEMGELQTTFNSMAQEVLRNMEELKALDAAKSDFLNIASHELRTPMTSIKGSLSLISSGVMGEVNPEVLNLIKIAETETDRLVRLINDILDMAKIDAKKLPLKQDWVPLKSLVEKTVMSLQGLSQSFGIEIVSHEFENIEVYADSDRIQQVITNLLSNAIKFSSKGKKVEVYITSKMGQPIYINIKDHGKGMTPQEKSILFQKFRQITSPDNPLVKGTGLGLAIAKALVEEHKGTIDVHTAPNEGSTFYFTLPTWRYEPFRTEKMAA